MLGVSNNGWVNWHTARSHIKQENQVKRYYSLLLIDCSLFFCTRIKHYVTPRGQEVKKGMAKESPLILQPQTILANQVSNYAQSLTGSGVSMRPGCAAGVLRAYQDTQGWRL